MLLEFQSSLPISRTQISQQPIDVEIKASKSELITATIRDIENRIANQVEQSANDGQIYLKLKVVLIFGENIEKLSNLIDELLEVDKDLAAKLLNILK